MANAYLEITLKIDDADRASAAGVYNQYKAPFLDTVKGAKSKELLVSEEKVQVLHGFDSVEEAKDYLSTDLFNNDVVVALKPYLKADPVIDIYSVV
ncbi:hypothetical protein [Chryseobacterium pennipullorum]|uniref:ABM domain-containing protein n=1 Tax=Chryseobacterium pennipullorum TaxID=2258963 RepID=A0A3D9B2R3_9FLAO|nr:hypothetical protein [Chryseobacterium pennipullorum]REC47536.1 hypothetical protein DRF67_10870 [Chryseobacterium pennipullorum]